MRASDRLRDWAGDPNLVGAITQDELHTIVTGYADCLDALDAGRLQVSNIQQVKYDALLSRAEGLFGETAKEQGL